VTTTFNILFDLGSYFLLFHYLNSKSTPSPASHTCSHQMTYFTYGLYVIFTKQGGEEFGFGTSAMVAAGCVMARVCHLNTCPVGVCTQKPELRAKFPGVPDDVVNYFGFVAEEVRMPCIFA